MSSEAANFEFWRRDSINGPDYSNIGPQKSLFERAMPKLTVVLTILVAILLPLAISNNIEINKTKGEYFDFLSYSSDYDLISFHVVYFLIIF